MTYFENRAVLRCNDSETEIEVRGGVEADDIPGGFEIVLRTTDGTHERRMRVSQLVWQKFVRAVEKLQ